MSLDNLRISIKDVIQLAIYVIGGTVFFISINNKVDLAISAISEMKSEKKEMTLDDKAFKQQIQNQINANSLQIQLMKQDIDIIKQGYYITKK